MVLIQKFTEAWGLSLTLRGFRSDNLKEKKNQNQKNYKATLHHLAASLCVGIQVEQNRNQLRFSLCFVPQHLCIWENAL